jgi:thiol-disulfide isomerase/thioredoxin
VAKTPAKKNAAAANRAQGRAPSKSAAGKAPNRRPAKPSAGRPAGLFTWLAIGLVVVVVATLVIIKVSGGGASNSALGFSATDPAMVAQLTKIPESVFDTVGVNSQVVQVSAPLALKNQPALTGTTAGGAIVPEILYIGAEYCPFCAAQRWATIIALSRFGTWSGLGNTTSAAKDQYPNTPTFTFAQAVYKSKYLTFKSVEEYTNQLNAAATNYVSLQNPTVAQQKLILKYDTPKYVPGLSSSQGNPIPFMTFANKFLVSGASYSPDTLTGLTRSAVATGLSDPTSPVTDAIIASANYQSAAICSLTKDQPSAVCTSSGVQAAAKAMKLK